jgi:hypothetical protein
MNVATRIVDNDMPFDRLREEYKGAFDEWAAQVNHLQAVSESAPGAAVVQEAEGRVEAAHRTYQDSRDRLAQDLSGCESCQDQEA